MRRINNKNFKTIRKIYAGVVLSLALCAIMAVGALAAGEGSDPLEILQNLNDVLFSVARLVGIGITMWGIVQLGMAFSAHDPSQRINGILGIAGGLLIIFAKEILQLIGALG